MSGVWGVIVPGTREGGEMMIFLCASRGRFGCLVCLPLVGCFRFVLDQLRFLPLLVFRMKWRYIGGGTRGRF